MAENPYQPPQIGAESRPRARPFGAPVKLVITGAAAALVGYVLFECLALAIERFLMGLDRHLLPRGLKASYLAAAAAILLTTYLTILAWRSQRWDWWVSVQIGVALTAWTALATWNVGF